MTIGIYGIFNAETNECLYIGMSKNIEQRWKSHLKNLKSKKHKRQDFVEWYHNNGAVKELLSFKILEECEYDETVLNLSEIKWFNEMSPKYFGKKPSLNEKWQYSEDTRNKTRETMKKVHFEQHCLKCNKFFYSKMSETKFCQVCRNNNRNKAYKKNKTKHKKCQICKKLINNRNKFCSSDCRITSYGIKCRNNNCNRFIEKVSIFCSKDCMIKVKTNNDKSSIIINGKSKGYIPYGDLYQMYITQKMTATAIAFKTGYTTASVLTWLRSYNIHIRSSREINNVKKEEKFLTELPDEFSLLIHYENNLSYAKIAEFYHVHKNKVAKWIKYYNFPKREQMYFKKNGIISF